MPTPEPTNRYTALPQGRGLYAVHSTLFGIVLDEIETEGGAEDHAAELQADWDERIADERAADAEAAADEALTLSLLTRRAA